MTATIYRINKAGAYAVGHLSVCGIRLDLGCPGTCRQVSLGVDAALALMRCLGAEFEDGAYLSDVLVGRNVLVEDDEGGRLVSIGDPYGNDAVILEGLIS